tara:strand:- start:210 stop:440 length:231 start_codon:yes stop_codon:yes gene_type:complete
MYKISEEQRKQLLQYFWAKPYGEVASHIGMLASLVKTDDSNSTVTKLSETKDKLNRETIVSNKLRSDHVNGNKIDG